MMSFSLVKSASSAGNYYTDKDNYYVLGSMDERWFGKGAEELGLKGSVDKNVFTELLKGKFPDKFDLSRMQEGVNKHRTGYDLTFSAPKSVSILGMLGGDKRLIEAHNRAVEVALQQVETFASTRSQRDGISETVLTSNLIIARFNHDTSRDQEPQLHTHSVVINATLNGDKWQALSSDTVGKTGFSENVLANQTTFGKMYRQALRADVEKMGYQTEVVGKHAMWEMTGVPVEVFSSRSKAIDEAVGFDASLKSRDMAALDTRKSKEMLNPEQKMVEWLQKLKETGFDIKAYKMEADKRAMHDQIKPEVSPLPPNITDKTDQITPEISPSPLDVTDKTDQITPKILPSSPDITDKTDQITLEKSSQSLEVDKSVLSAISLLSERKVQFTYTDILAKTVSQLPAEPGVFELARSGIDQAIERQQLIPLDKEKGVFTSNIHILDELSINALSEEVLRNGHVATFPERSIPRQKTYSDAVTVLAQDKPSLAILSGIGGASVQRDRIAELVTMAHEQGRDVQILSVDKKSQDYLQQDSRLSDEGIMGKKSLVDNTAFIPGSTLIVEQGEKLTLKETVTLLDGAIRNNVQILVTDSQQRKGTGNALSVLSNAGVNVYRWQGGKQIDTTILSEPDKNQRLTKLSQDFAANLKAGKDSVAQVVGVRDQAFLNREIRGALKEQGVLSEQETTLHTLVPVWLDNKSRKVRDNYREGMVMERWNPEERKRDRFVIDRVNDQTHSLRLRDVQGETQVIRLSALDSQWSLYRSQTLPVAEGEKLAVLAKENISEVSFKSGDVLQVTKIEKGVLTVMRNGVNKPQTLPISTTPFDAVKVNHNYVEGLGRSVSDSATIFAAVSQRDLDQATLNQLSRSGSYVRLYSALDTNKVTEKLARHSVFNVVSEQIKMLAGHDSLEQAVQLQQERLHTPVQQAIHLSIPILENQSITFSQPDLMVSAHESSEGKFTHTEIGQEIKKQIKQGELISVGVAQGYGNNLLISRTAFEAEKSILRHIVEGKNAVTPLMEKIPDSVLSGLTDGQQNATRMILETPDRFVVVQGYAGVGKTTQFRSVMEAINQLPETQRPQIVGLAPTHRAVSEMRDAGISGAQTLASFLHDTKQQQKQGEPANYHNTLFIVDESSMIGNVDMAKTYAFISAGGGRAVSSGDSDQLQSIAPGQSFRLQQVRSAADVAIMKEIVRQTPELKPAIYSMIARDIESSLETMDKVKPEQVPRRNDAWLPENSVMEIRKQDEKGVSQTDKPVTIHESIKIVMQGYTGEEQNKENVSQTEKPSSLLDALEAVMQDHHERKQNDEIAQEDKPETIYEAIVSDYLGRTPEAQIQTLIVTHLNNDRRIINSLIHDERKKRGELGEQVITLPILVTSNIKDGELRRLTTWQENASALARLDNKYYQISQVDKENQLVRLQDNEGNTRLLSPKEMVSEGVTLYSRDQIEVGIGDKMRFSRSDNERGYISNSLWEISSIKSDSITLSDGKQTRTLTPASEEAHQHIDLAYAVTAHAAQGASESFVIALEGVEDSRKHMVSYESAYVALSRAKQHIQVYTDNLKGWIAAVGRDKSKGSIHDVLFPQDERSVKNANRLINTAKPLTEVAAGRALLGQAGLQQEPSLARFIAPSNKYPQPHVALPMYDKNGKSAGIWLNVLTRGDAISPDVFSGQGRVFGKEDAQFVALQASRNGENLLASDMNQGVYLAREHPSSGIIVRLSGDGRPWNPAAMTGGKLWGEGISDVAEQTEKTTIIPEIQSLRTAEEEQKIALEKQAEKTAREITDSDRVKDYGEEKLSYEKVKAIVDDVVKSWDGKPLPDKQSMPDFPEQRYETEAIKQVIAENQQRERLQSMEQDIVKDLSREKTWSGD
ncbi:conjugative transfer relaxase/helicase TraI [Xenorhabdus sp. XENO-1]|uniref:conjugative transfer relaxase/helicase TraI n=1 Tax=Xenorhabdus bovienii TaxID=40576 RepID=UPI0020CA82B4|nr:conjugative transfer relaxase/helicase TraI [Xenorhabdus bovienii]MCP9269158.1 conjugative transfer relaxase/helicase TraI [Xenorhabdus bovienii subsp. africana]